MVAIPDGLELLPPPASLGRRLTRQGSSLILRARFPGAAHLHQAALACVRLATSLMLLVFIATVSSTAARTSLLSPTRRLAVSAMALGLALWLLRQALAGLKGLRRPSLRLGADRVHCQLAGLRGSGLELSRRGGGEASSAGEFAFTPAELQLIQLTPERLTLSGDPFSLELPGSSLLTVGWRTGASFELSHAWFSPAELAWLAAFLRRLRQDRAACDDATGWAMPDECLVGNASERGSLHVSPRALQIVTAMAGLVPALLVARRLVF